MNPIKSILLCGTLFTALPIVTFAQTADPNQSSARPLGLSIVGQVDQGGSDTASAAFQSNYLPPIDNLVNTQLGENHAMSTANLHQVDPTSLTLATDYDARVYFVGEGAGYWNTIGFNTIAPGSGLPTGGTDSSSQIIFPNASSSVSALAPGSTPSRSSSEPLLPGDFVDLGHFTAGSALDFFLVSNGARGGTNVFTDDAARNPDHFEHMVAFAQPNSPYLILSWEDLWGGGDKDFNDVIIAVDIGATNVQRLISAPEPGTWLILTAFLGLAFWTQRRHAALYA